MTRIEGQTDPHAWLHDLRNAVNVAVVSSTLARRMFADADTARALQALDRVDGALARVGALLCTPGDEDA